MKWTQTKEFKSHIHAEVIDDRPPGAVGFRTYCNVHFTEHPGPQRLTDDLTAATCHQCRRKAIEKFTSRLTQCDVPATKP